METSYLKTLELDKIIARAAEGCVCKEARAMLLAIEPQCDPDEVRYALEQTDAINTLLIKNGSPRFGGVEGVSQLAARAVKGGVLSMGELLMVAGALRNFQHLTSWYGSSEHDALPTDDLFYALAPEPGLEQQISSAILAPDAMADTASHTLNDLRKKIRATENSIRDRLESMVRNMDTSKYLQESVVSMRNGRDVQQAVCASRNCRVDKNRILKTLFRHKIAWPHMLHLCQFYRLAACLPCICQKIRACRRHQGTSRKCKTESLCHDLHCGCSSDEGTCTATRTCIVFCPV